MENLINLAKNVNWGLNTRNKNLFLDSATQLYNYVQRTGASILTKLEDSGDFQAVGKAFSYNARFLDNGDLDINSVAAENGYYCMAKSIIAGNYFAAPELYNLLEQTPDLLMDKFISARMPDVQEMTGMPIVMLYGNPHQSDDAKEEARKYIPYVKFYVISQFYDIKTNKTRMPEDIIEYSLDKVISDINQVLKDSSIEESLKIGKDYFNKVLKEIEKILLNY